MVTTVPELNGKRLILIEPNHAYVHATPQSPEQLVTTIIARVNYLAREALMRYSLHCFALDAQWYLLFSTYEPMTQLTEALLWKADADSRATFYITLISIVERMHDQRSYFTALPFSEMYIVGNSFNRVFLSGFHRLTKPSDSLAGLKLALETVYGLMKKVEMLRYALVVAETKQKAEPNTRCEKYIRFFQKDAPTRSRELSFYALREAAVKLGNLKSWENTVLTAGISEKLNSQRLLGRTIELTHGFQQV